MPERNTSLTTLPIRPEESLAPDLRDGMSDIQRRLLRAIERKVAVTRKQIKARSDTVLKEVLGARVPPLEASLVGLPGDHANVEPFLTTYLELVRMAQPFRTRYPLVMWDGFVGTMDGQSPSEPVFNRCGLTILGSAALTGSVPTLLVNGTGGAVVRGIHFLPHHLGEILAAAATVVQEPAISDEDLVSLVSGPDFPVGGLLPEAAAAREAYLTGRGSVSLRANLRVVEDGTLRAAVLEEMPYWVTVSELLTDLTDAVRSGALRRISDVKDQTSERGVPRLMLVFRSGVSVDAAFTELFSRTRLETKLQVDMRAWVDGTLRRVTFPEMLRAYVRQLRGSLTKQGEHDVSPERVLAELAELGRAHSDVRRTRIERSGHGAT
jgi:DNA gyrase subunit A